MTILRSFLVVSIIFVALPAQASDLTVFGGVQHQGKLTLGSSLQNASSITFDPRNFGVFGVRLSTGSIFGTENTLAYVPNFVDSRNKAIIYNGNFLVQFPTPKVKPYATVGLGAFFTSGESIFDFGNKFAINYGGGLKILPAGPVGIGFDVRGYSIPDLDTQILTVGETLNIVEVSVGVVFAF